MKHMNFLVILGFMALHSVALASDDGRHKRLRSDSMDIEPVFHPRVLSLMQSEVDEDEKDEEGASKNIKKRDSELDLCNWGLMKKVSVLENHSELNLIAGVAYCKVTNQIDPWVQEYFNTIQGTYRGELVTHFITAFHHQKPIKNMDEYIDLCKATRYIPDVNFSHISYEFQRICTMRETYYLSSYEALMQPISTIPVERLSSTVDALVQMLFIEDYEDFPRDLKHLLSCFNDLSLQALTNLPGAIFQLKMQATAPMQIALNARKTGYKSPPRQRYKWLADAVMLADRQAASQARQFAMDLPQSPESDPDDYTDAEKLMTELHKLSLAERFKKY